MKIDVETISEACRTCPDFEIRTINYFADHDVYNRHYFCEHLDTCREAIRRSTVKKEGHNE